MFYPSNRQQTKTKAGTRKLYCSYCSDRHDHVVWEGRGRVGRSAEDRGLLCGILLGSKNSLRAICIALFGLITCGSGQLQLKNQLWMGKEYSTTEMKPLLYWGNWCLLRLKKQLLLRRDQYHRGEVLWGVFISSGSAHKSCGSEEPRLYPKLGVGTW